MSASQSLTRAARYERERQLAEAALAEYGLGGAPLSLIKYSNTYYAQSAGEVGCTDAGRPTIDA